jgi:hypothetical protein
MYWNAQISTDVNEQPGHLSMLHENAVINMFKGGVTMSFASEDPSRHVTLYSLNGKNVLDIPASSRSVSILYGSNGLRNGVYTAEIKSEKMQMSRMLTVTTN